MVKVDVRNLRSNCARKDDIEVRVRLLLDLGPLRRNEVENIRSEGSWRGESEAYIPLFLCLSLHDDE